MPEIRRLVAMEEARGKGVTSDLENFSLPETGNSN
jgi:hypothetical protein